MHDPVLSELRQRSGLSQEALAEAAGIGVRTIRDIERGTATRPRRDTVRRLAEALRLPPEIRDRFETYYGNGTSNPIHPYELPHDIDGFVGRRTELSRIERVLTPQPDQSCPPVVAVVGPGGVGKSTLAVHAGHRLAAAYPDGQLFARLGGHRPTRPTLDQVLADLLASLGVAPSALPVTTSARAGLFRSLTAGRRLLIVLDDATDAYEICELLPGTGPAAVVITSRLTLAELGVAETVRLGPLARVDGRRLLGHTAGRDIPSDAADELLALCGDLPLAVRIVGARLATRPDWTVAHYADRLRDERQRLDELTYGSLDVAASLRLSYRALADGAEPEAADAFTQLAMIPGADFSLETAVVALGKPVWTVDRLLGTLIDAGMVETGRNGRYAYHDLTRLFARALGEERPGLRQRLLDRLGEHYSGQLRSAIRLRIIGSSLPEDEPLVTQDPGDDQVDAVVDWLHAEYLNCCAFVLETVADRDPDIERAYKLARRLANVTDGRRAADMQTALASAIRDAAAGRPEAQCYASWAQRDLAKTAALCRHLEEASALLAEARDLPDDSPVHRAECAYVEGLLRAFAGDFGEAAEQFRLVRRLDEAAAETYRVATLCCLGNALYLDGRHREALTYRMRSVDLLRRHGSLHMLTYEVSGLAEIVAALGNTDRAVTLAEEAVGTAGRLGMQNLEAATTHSLAVTLRQAGREAEALAAFRACLRHAESVGDPTLQADCLIELADPTGSGG